MQNTFEEILEGLRREQALLCTFSARALAKEVSLPLSFPPAPACNFGASLCDMQALPAGCRSVAAVNDCLAVASQGASPIAAA